MHGCTHSHQNPRPRSQLQSYLDNLRKLGALNGGCDSSGPSCVKLSPITDYTQLYAPGTLLYDLDKSARDYALCISPAGQACTSASVSLRGMCLSQRPTLRHQGCSSTQVFARPPEKRGCRYTLEKEGFLGPCEDAHEAEGVDVNIVTERGPLLPTPLRLLLLVSRPVQSLACPSWETPSTTSTTVSASTSASNVHPPQQISAKNKKTRFRASKTHESWPCSKSRASKSSRSLNP